MTEELSESPTKEALKIEEKPAEAIKPPETSEEIFARATQMMDDIHERYDTATAAHRGQVEVVAADPDADATDVQSARTQLDGLGQEGKQVVDGAREQVRGVIESKQGDIQDKVAGNLKESIQTTEKKSQVSLVEEAIAEIEAQKYLENSNITDPDKIAAITDQFRRTYVGNGLNYGKFEALALADAAKIREKGLLTDEDTREAVAFEEEAKHWHTYANSIKVALIGDREMGGLDSATDEAPESAQTEHESTETLPEVVSDTVAPARPEQIVRPDTENVMDQQPKPLTESPDETDQRPDPSQEIVEDADEVVESATSAPEIRTTKKTEATKEEPEKAEEKRTKEVKLERRLFEIQGEVREGNVSSERTAEITNEVRESLEGSHDFYRLIDGANIARSLNDPSLAKLFLSLAETNNQSGGKITPRLSAENSCLVARMFAETGDIRSAQGSMQKAKETYPDLSDGNSVYMAAVKEISKRKGVAGRLFRRQR